jgi:acetolactate synthase-1/2/3 large subunit
VQSAALGVYPDAHTAAMTRTGVRAPLASIAPVPDFERYVQASRGYGERVTERAQLLPALDRAAQAVLQGRQALLNVMGI